MSTENSINLHFRTLNEYLDSFTTKGLYWYIKEDSRGKFVRNKLDKASVGQVFFK